MNNQYNNNKKNSYRRNRYNGYHNNGSRNNGYMKLGNSFQPSQNYQNQMYNNGYYGYYPLGYNQYFDQYITNPLMMPTIFNNSLNNKQMIPLSNTNQSKLITDSYLNKIITPTTSLSENNKSNEKNDTNTNTNIKIKPKIIIRQLPKNPKDKEIIKVIPFNPENGDNISDIFTKILSDIIKDVDKPETEKNNEEINNDFTLNREIQYEELVDKHESLEDLIKIGKLYKESDKNKYAFNFEVLHKIVEPLEELNNVIGMNSVKTTIVNQIVYFLLGLEPCKDMLHTVIQGPPGVCLSHT